MIVWLVDFDGKIENLALMRLSTYHKRMGDMVRLIHGPPFPSIFEVPDKIYLSCLFSWNGARAFGWAKMWGSILELGGTGVVIKKRLPKAVEQCPPDYLLYYNRKASAKTIRAIGFISRGCTRSCLWCVVRKKEGLLYRVSSAKDIAEMFDSALFLDNNFLALPDCKKDLQWLVDSQVSVDFNQGLDIRYVNKPVAELLSKCNWTSGIRFALDSLGYMSTFEHKFSILLQAGIKPASLSVYALIGFSGTRSDIARLCFLRGLGVRVYPMGYRNLETCEEPAKGWDLRLYKKYRRLITRMPFAKTVWRDFYTEVVHNEPLVENNIRRDLF